MGGQTNPDKPMKQICVGLPPMLVQADPRKAKGLSHYRSITQNR